MKLKLLSVSVGLPKPIAVTAQGEVVLSGIAKPRVTNETVFVGRENIEGDGQADLRVHGGRDKAVYAYPSEHWMWWQKAHGLVCSANTFGENLTVEGADERDIRIGDRFRWGEALLEVSQPRAPCFKLGLHTREDIPARLTQSGRCGWYLRVVEVGFAAVNGALVREVESEGPTVREAFVAALHPREPQDLRDRVRTTPALAEAWKRAIRTASA